MKHNLELLAASLPENADGALIISGTNRRYFTGFVSSAGQLLVTREKAYLLVDFRYGEAAMAQAEGCKVVVYHSLGESLTQILTQQHIQSVLLEGSAFTLNDAAAEDQILRQAGTVSIKDDTLDGLIDKLRIIKTSDEVDKVIMAQRITEKALEETLKLVKEGVCERDLALELEYKMRKLGADGISFDLIVIAGEKTSMPHGVPGDYCIRQGDFITFDIGALYQGYHSDMTRTYALGEISPKQKRVYRTVYEAQAMGLAAVRSGVTCSSVDKAARDYIDQAGFQGCFGHSTGHGVGLDIHEQPFISSRNDKLLYSGSIITVEPGIYLPGEFGVRIEDMAVVTTDGCVNLSAISKELTIL